MSEATFKVEFLDAGTLPQRLRFDAALPIAYEAHNATPDDAVAERIADADVVVTNKNRLTSERLALAPKLQLFCVAAAGGRGCPGPCAASKG